MTLLRPLTLSAALLAAGAPALAHAPQGSSAFTLRSDQPRTPEQLAVRFDAADLAIRVMPDSKSIEAVATLTFTATSPIERLVVELDARFTITSVQIDGVELSPDDDWANDDGRLWAQLEDTLRTGESAVLRIAYSGQPRTAPRAPWDGGFVWTTAPSGEPWIATAVQGEGCDLFWPCIDHPLAEPGRVDLHITVPSGLAAPSNGRFLGAQDHGDGWTTWNWSARQPNTYAIALNIGPYEKVEQTYQSRFGNSFPLEYWHLRSDDPAKVAGLFAQFAPMVAHYEATVGPYPFADEKMGVVETPHLGMEHQTINAYGNGYKLDGKGYDWLLHHELAHEWFGNQLTHQNADHMWLHEGLGTYWQPLYLRTVDGERGLQAELREYRLRLANRFPVVSGREQDNDTVYFGGTGPGNDIYFKGALVAHSLRMLIGDEAFFRSVTRLVYGRPDPRPGQFAPRNGTTQELMAIVAEEAGRNLDWFFHAYLYQAALPVLEQQRDGDRLILAWRTGDNRPFPMPLEVEVDGRVQTLLMTDGRGELSLSPGAVVVVDPMSKVLRQQDHVDAWLASRAAS